MAKMNEYQLLKEEKGYFHLKHEKDGAEFKVSKKGLDGQMLKKIASLRSTQILKAADGLEVEQIKEKPLTVESIKEEKPVDIDLALQDKSSPLEIDPIEKTQDIIPSRDMASAPPTSAPPKLESAIPIQQKIDPRKYYPNGTFDDKLWAADHPDSVPVSTQTANLKAANEHKEAQQQIESNRAIFKRDEVDQYNQEAAKAGLPLKEYPQDVKDYLSHANAKSPTELAEPPTSALPIDSSKPKSPSDATNPLNYVDEYNKAFEQQEAGVKAGTKAQEDQGAKAAEAYDQENQKLQKLSDGYQAKVKSLSDDSEKLFNEAKEGKINPNQWWENRSTGGKIASAISLILGGLGGGLSGRGGNVGLDIINRAIDHDIESQKQNLNNKHSLLSMNLARTKNLNEAVDMTKSMMLAGTGAQISKIAAQTQGPVAKAAEMQSLAELKQKIAAMHQNVAINGTLMNLGTSGITNPNTVAQVINNIGIINPEKAKELRERFVPGVGVAQVTVPTEVRGELTARQQLDEAVRDLRAWSKQHAGSIDPEITRYGATKAAELQSMYRNAIKGGVFKKGEQEFIGTIVDADPTKFFNSLRVDPKFRAIQDSNTMQLNSLKKSYGLPTTGAAPQSGRPIQFTPNKPDKLILGKN